VYKVYGGLNCSRSTIQTFCFVPTKHKTWRAKKKDTKNTIKQPRWRSFDQPEKGEGTRGCGKYPPRIIPTGTLYTMSQRRKTRQITQNKEKDAQITDTTHTKKYTYDTIKTRSQTFCSNLFFPLSPPKLTLCSI